MDDNSQGESRSNPLQRAGALDELERQFRNDRLEDGRREHAFYRYWSQRMEEQGTLGREELEKLTEFALRWPDPVSGIVGDLCVHDKLATEDVQWLLSVFPESSWVRRQLLACSVLRDGDLDWETRLGWILDLRAEWAVHRLLRVLPADAADAAEELIRTSRIAEDVKNRYLHTLRQPAAA